MKKLLFILFVIFVVACSEDEVIPIPEQLAALKENVPENWDVTVRVDQFSSETTTILTEKPKYVALFINRVDVLSDTVCDGLLYPSLILNFYPVAQKESVVDSIESIHFYGECMPFIYAETNEFIAITSDCFKNHGCIARESQTSLVPLNVALKEYFKNLQN